MENEKEEWTELVKDTARRAAEECTLTDGHRIVSVMRSSECVGYQCSWADVVSEPGTGRSGIEPNEGILLDWDELGDDELEAMEAMCPDAYSVALHLLKGDMGLEDAKWARPATDPVQGVCLLACDAPYLGDYEGMGPVEAGRAWLEDISEIDGVREKDASRFLRELGDLCEDDALARVSAKDCGVFLELSSYGHNLTLAIENSKVRNTVETKDKNREEIGISPRFNRQDAALLADWYHLEESEAADIIGKALNQAHSRFVLEVWDLADAKARGASDFAKEHPDMPTFDVLDAMSGRFPGESSDTHPGRVTPSELKGGDLKPLEDFLDSWASENPTLAETFVAAMEDHASHTSPSEAIDRDGGEI